MKLPVLYSRRSDGKVQAWSITVDGSRYRTTSWINPDGACTPSEWTQAKGKQKRTHEEQAEKEAKAAHKKKLDEGYCESEADIDKPKFFSPMLAKIYEDYSFDVEQALDGGERVWVQPKLDGMRCVAQRGGLTSRNGKAIVCAPHIQDAVNARFTSNLKFVVDGELYAHKFANDFEQIMSLAKKTQPDFQDLIEAKKHLQYHIYDLPEVADEKGALIAPFLATFGERLNQMRFLFSACEGPIVLVETVQVKSLDEIGENFARWRAAGYEGAMIRLDRSYGVGKRSKHLLKYKKFLDAEFQIVSVNEGEGNRAGMAGSLTCRMLDGRTFNCGIRGDTTGFKSLWALRDTPSTIVGRRATITYQNLTSDGIPRFPIFLRVRDEE